MTYTSSAIDTRELRYAAPAKARSRSVPMGSIMARVLGAMMVSRQRQAEREVARYLADTGGKFTDETEREIERRFLSTPRW